MKKIIATTIAAMLMLGSSFSAMAQGIPVIDAASLASQAAHYVEVIGQWQQQYQNMISQINTMQSQLKAVTGTRDLGQLFNNQALYQQLPPDMKAVYQDVKSAGGSLAGYNAKNDGDRAYYGTINTNVNQLQSGYQASLDRLTRLQGLMQNIDTTQDQKASQDLANRISAEQALLSNETAKIQLMTQLQNMQMKIAEEQQSQNFRSMLFSPR